MTDKGNASMRLFFGVILNVHKYPENPEPVPLSPHKSHMDWHGIETAPPRLQPLEKSPVVGVV